MARRVPAGPSLPSTLPVAPAAATPPPPHACIEGRTEMGTRAARAHVRTASPLRSEFPSPTASRVRTHVADEGPSTRHSSTASPSPTTIGSPRGAPRSRARLGDRHARQRPVEGGKGQEGGCPAGGRFREETGLRARPTTPERALRWPARSLPPPGRRGLLLPPLRPLLVAGPRRSPVSAEPLVRPVHSAEPPPVLSGRPCPCAPFATSKESPPGIM